MARRSKNRGKGWWEEPRRHSQAAKLGWQRRYAQIAKKRGLHKGPIHRVRRYYIDIHNKRSKKARIADESKTSKDTVQVIHARSVIWPDRKGRMDIEGVDTKKKKKREPWQHTRKELGKSQVGLNKK